MNNKSVMHISLRLWGAGLLILLLLIVIVFSGCCLSGEVLTIAGIVFVDSLPALLMLLMGIAFIRKLSCKAAIKSLLSFGLMLLIILVYWLGILLFFVGIPDRQELEDSFIYFFLPLVATAFGSFLINRSFLLDCYQAPADSSNQTN
jgi:hypothetical protein